MEKQMVIFKLSEEFFGVEIACVESIIKVQEITRMPQAPEFVEGVINLRGRVLPVINLEQRLELPVHVRNQDTRIIVVSIDQVEVGMIVSAVSEVLTIDDKFIEPAPPMVTTVNSTFIAGIARMDTRLIILLDINQVLTRNEKILASLIRM
jgi:purine-binding chemotaxis protein CheW